MKKKKKTIFERLHKQTAPPTKKFKTRKDELDRKAKHKEKNGISEYTDNS